MIYIYIYLYIFIYICVYLYEYVYVHMSGGQPACPPHLDGPFTLVVAIVVVVGGMEPHREPEAA